MLAWWWRGGRAWPQPRSPASTAELCWRLMDVHGCVPLVPGCHQPAPGGGGAGEAARGGPRAVAGLGWMLLLTPHRVTAPAPAPGHLPRPQAAAGGQGAGQGVGWAVWCRCEAGGGLPADWATAHFPASLHPPSSGGTVRAAVCLARCCSAQHSRLNLNLMPNISAQWTQ